MQITKETSELAGAMLDYHILLDAYNDLQLQVEHYKEIARQYTNLSSKGIYYTLEELVDHDRLIAKEAFIEGAKLLMGDRDINANEYILKRFGKGYS